MGPYFALQLPCGFDYFCGAGNHPLPTVRGRAGKGSESAGLGADLEFVATVATGGRVKFLSAV